MACVEHFSIAPSFLQGTDLELQEREPEKLAKIFTARGSGWMVSSPHGYGGPGDGEWSYATARESGWSDYSAEFDFKLVGPADRKDGLEIGAYTRYHALANLGGYEAAAIARYESSARHYRIAISSLWKEVILWRPNGGVVQVSPFPFEIGTAYRLRIDCRGPRLTVYINGDEVIDWWDQADPVLKGGIGVARKEWKTNCKLPKASNNWLRSFNGKPQATV